MLLEMSFSPTAEPADGLEWARIHVWKKMPLDGKLLRIGRQSRTHESPESRLYKLDTDEFGWQESTASV